VDVKAMRFDSTNRTGQGEPQQQARAHAAAAHCTMVPVGVFLVLIGAIARSIPLIVLSWEYRCSVAQNDFIVLLERTAVSADWSKLCQQDACCKSCHEAEDVTAGSMQRSYGSMQAGAEQNSDQRTVVRCCAPSVCLIEW
jgi:hypothetical protein